MEFELLHRLINCFDNSFINQDMEFIAHRKANMYFRLSDCEGEFDIKCKMLEWFSRGAFEAEPFHSVKKNKNFHKFMLNGINQFLGTNFKETDMDVIYTYLGNAVDHEKTIAFINSGYDMKILMEVQE